MKNLARVGRFAALLAAGVALVLYTLTAAPTATWLHNGADSGELTAAALILGVPHPPGYPLYTLLAAAFARLPIGEPAFGVALLSALAGAAAVYVLARAGNALLAPRWAGQAYILPAHSGSLAATLVPPLAALTFGLSPLVWSQATIPEVYTLNLFFVALVLWACLTDDARRVKVAALAFGLGTVHHLSILLFVPGALIALRPRRSDSSALFWYLAPLSLFAYLPLASLANPAVKWSDATTLDGFVWLVTAAPYRSYLGALSLEEIVTRVEYTARALVDQFTVAGVALLVWGLTQQVFERARLALALLLMVVPITAYAVAYASRDSFIYLIPAFAIALLWLIYGAGNVLRWLGGRRWLRGAAVALFALLPLYNGVMNYESMDVSTDRAAFDYARQNLASLPEDGVLFADGDEALFALWYYRFAVPNENTRSVIVSQGLLQYDWYYDGLRRIMSEVQFQPPEAVTDAPQRAQEIVSVTFAEGRTICFTTSSPLLPKFEYAPRGVLKCVVAEK